VKHKIIYYDDSKQNGFFPFFLETGAQIKMRKEIKGQLIGGIIGALVGGFAAYLVWDFSSPGGILIIAGFAIGGFIGYSLGLKRIDAQR